MMLMSLSHFKYIICQDPFGAINFNFLIACLSIICISLVLLFLPRERNRHLTSVSHSLIKIMKINRMHKRQYTLSKYFLLRSCQLKRSFDKISILSFILSITVGMVEKCSERVLLPTLHTVQAAQPLSGNRLDKKSRDAGGAQQNSTSLRVGDFMLTSTVKHYYTGTLGEKLNRNPKHLTFWV